MFIGDFPCIKDSVYIDDGYSGTNFNRPGFQRIDNINSLVMYDEVGPDGQLHSYIDEDMKIQVQMKIVDALQNMWRRLY